MSRNNQLGFSLIELCVIIVIIGILSGVMMQSMTNTIDATRQAQTERELKLIAEAIVGDPQQTINGVRSEFGFVGDVGQFPTTLSQLYTNPGNLPTWDGPYLVPATTEDTVSWQQDAWGNSYTYSSGVSVSSSGGGSSFRVVLADSPADLLRNKIYGTLVDAAGATPGASKKDSVKLLIDLPAGVSGTITRQYAVDSTGAFAFDSIPVGIRKVRAIYTPANDTTTIYLSVLPRHRSTTRFPIRLTSTFFSVYGGGCVNGSIILRPMDNGETNEITDTLGCEENWDCVDDPVADDDASMLTVANNSFRTELYELEDPVDITCTITSVTVFVIAYRDQNQGTVRGLLRTGGTNYTSATSTLTNSYQTYSYTWATNPNTGVAWTWANINILQAGFDLKGQSSTKKSHATQCYVEVAYQ